MTTPVAGYDESSGGPAHTQQGKAPRSHGPRPSGGHSRIRLWTGRTALVVWVAVVTALVLPLVFRADANVGPGRFEFRFRPSMSGRTELVLAPLGSISARTHRAPVTLTIGLDELDVSSAIGSTKSGGSADLEHQIRDGIPGAALRIGLMLLAASALVGAAAALAFPGRRSPLRIASGAAVAVIVTAALAAPIAPTYDSRRLISNPEIRGPIASSDALVAKLTGLDSRFGTVQSRVEALSKRISELYSSATTRDVARSDGDVVLLHVSDLHLNGVGLSLARDLAERFDVDAVVDTGDFTSFGFAPEAGFTDQLKGFTVPYYLVAGNHDSSSVRAELRRSPYLHYIDGQTFRVRGLTILGIADPTNTALRTIPQETIHRTYEKQFTLTERLVKADEPDLLLVHNPVQIQPVLGQVRVAAAGHLHVTRTEVIRGTVVAIVGSSGATGLGNLLVNESQPYRFQLLRFSDRELVAIDDIELRGDGGDFTLRRTMFTHDQPDSTDSLPEPSADEPSREQVEQDDPDALDAVTSTQPTATTRPRGTSEGPGDHEPVVTTTGTTSGATTQPSPPTTMQSGG